MKLHENATSLADSPIVNSIICLKPINLDMQPHASLPQFSHKNISHASNITSAANLVTDGGTTTTILATTTSTSATTTTDFTSPTTASYIPSATKIQWDPLDGNVDNIISNASTSDRLLPISNERHRSRSPLLKGLHASGSTSTSLWRSGKSGHIYWHQAPHTSSGNQAVFANHHRSDQREGKHQWSYNIFPSINENYYV